MKVLLDVIKTLLLINGAVVLPSFLLVMAFYEQKSTNVASADNVSSKFHRNIEDDTLNYKQKLEQLTVQNGELQAKLETSQRTNSDTSVLPHRSSVEMIPTQVSPVSQSQPGTAQSRPSVNQRILAKAATVSPNKVQPRLPQHSVVNPRVSTARSSQWTVVEDTKPSYSSHKVAFTTSTSITHESSDGHVSSNQPVRKTVPQGFISLADLNQSDQKAQDKSPMDLSNDLSVGLIVADNRNELNYGTRNYRKVQTAIRSLRKGTSKTLEEAAKQAGIDLKTLKSLAQYGQNRPGSFNPNHISRANFE
ncbi:MAG: hypothetical protein QNJ37_13940 [Crocosphaera sp.]|nr:hypothetical protein [Crocosphaera sp.]